MEKHGIIASRLPGDEIHSRHGCFSFSLSLPLAHSLSPLIFLIFPTDFSASFHKSELEDFSCEDKTPLLLSDREAVEEGQKGLESSK